MFLLPFNHDFPHFSQHSLFANTESYFGRIVSFLQSCVADINLGKPLSVVHFNFSRNTQIRGRPLIIWGRGEDFRRINFFLGKPPDTFQIFFCDFHHAAPQMINGQPHMSSIDKVGTNQEQLVVMGTFNSSLRTYTLSPVVKLMDITC